MGGGDLFEEYRPWALAIAGKYCAKRGLTGMVKDEICNSALIGLMDAVKRFDPTRGIPFQPYASRRITGEILDMYRRESEQDSRKVALMIKRGILPPTVRKLETIKDKDGDQMEDRRPHREQEQQAAHLEAVLDGLRLKQIAEKMELSESRMCQLEREALNALRASVSARAANALCRRLGLSGAVDAK